MGLVGVGGQLGLTAGVAVVGAGRGLGWAGGGWEALPIAAAALAAAKATAKGIVGLAGEGSHLDLLLGLPDSPPSCVGCRVLLHALGWTGSAAATIAASACLPAATAASSPLGTAASCLSPATPATETPERYVVSV